MKNCPVDEPRDRNPLRDQPCGGLGAAEVRRRLLDHVTGSARRDPLQDGHEIVPVSAKERIPKVDAPEAEAHDRLVNVDADGGKRVEHLPDRVPRYLPCHVSAENIISGHVIEREKDVVGTSSIERTPGGPK